MVDAFGGPSGISRKFQFAIVNDIVHEVAGHVLTTFLSSGTAQTPPTSPFLCNSVYTEGRDVGEAGVYLEKRLFGGVVEYDDGPSPTHVSFVCLCLATNQRTDESRLAN